MRQPEFEKEDEEMKADSQQIHNATIQEREGDLEREQAAMLAEHAAALAREEYEYFHDGNGRTNEQIKREAQNLAVWYGISKGNISLATDTTPDVSGICTRMEHWFRVR